MCEKEAKKNLMNRLQVRKKDSYERINEYKGVKNKRKGSKKIKRAKKKQK